MYRSPQPRFRKLKVVGTGVLLVIALAPTGSAQASAPPSLAKPTFSQAAAFDTSKPLRELANSTANAATAKAADASIREVRPERAVPSVAESSSVNALSGDGAVQSAVAPDAIGAPLANFEGLSNQDNFNVFGFRVNPPDPNGEVGPNHYVEMINLVFAVYSKTGTLLLGPVDTGALWAGFPINDCTDPSGDPIVIYDQFADRWILTQFTTRGLDDPSLPFFNCVAISTTGDPTGSYFRYAFTTGFNFPDYPKYGVWRDSYLVTTREFGPTEDIYGIGVYGLERNKMIEGDPNARAVSFLLEDSAVPINLIGDGLLPPDIDGTTKPKNDVPAPIIGTQDNGGPYGATFDALNIWEFDVKWHSTPTASINLKAQLPVAGVRLDFPLWCRPRFPAAKRSERRDCLPQPGITNGASSSTSSPTGSGRSGGLPTEMPALSKRWSPTSRSRRPPASAEPGGTRSAAPTGSTASTSRARSRPMTASTAGWAASRWTRTATQPWATASSTARTSSPESGTRAASPATRSAR